MRHERANKSASKLTIKGPAGADLLARFFDFIRVATRSAPAPVIGTWPSHGGTIWLICWLIDCPRDTGLLRSVTDLQIRVDSLRVVDGPAVVDGMISRHGGNYASARACYGRPAPSIWVVDELSPESYDAQVGQPTRIMEATIRSRARGWPRHRILCRGHRTQELKYLCGGPHPFL